MFHDKSDLLTKLKVTIFYNNIYEIVHQVKSLLVKFILLMAKPHYIKDSNCRIVDNLNLYS